VEEDFWDDLLAHVRQRELIAITGPDLNSVTVDGAQRTLTEIIAGRLVERYSDISPSRMTMGEAVAAFIREHGRERAARLYRIVNDIIAEVEDQPCAPLRTLVAITDLTLFVSTTPDRMLAKAINDVRFDGRQLARELTFSPNQPTSVQARNMLAPVESDSTVVRLFGHATSTPQFALHDEDLLEWLHALLSDSGSLPDWIAFALKHQPLLFIGCEIPDWLGLFLLRLASSTRVWTEEKQFFFVASPKTEQPWLTSFSSTYCRENRVQELWMEPSEFVAELHSRWQAHAKVVTGGARPVTSETIFISYVREDIDQARRLHKAITELGGDAWLDERRLLPGNAWNADISETIGKARLFIAVVSANTEQREEGYYVREWRLALDRAKEITRPRFIIPVVVDDRPMEPERHPQALSEFHPLHFGHAPSGEPDAALLTTLIDEIRAMRRTP
jgi:hypothetical protein